MACRTGCRTQDHASWGECARQSGIRVDGQGFVAEERAKERRLSRYASARKAGIQPAGTRLHQIQQAEVNGGVEPTVKGHVNRDAYKFKREEAA